MKSEFRSLGPDHSRLLALMQVRNSQCRLRCITFRRDLRATAGINRVCFKCGSIVAT